jgi:hypothetical protein
LVGLTIASFLFSEGKLTGHTLLLFIMGITIIKFTSIGLQFVELKHSHPFWKIIFIGFILFFSIMVYGFI